MTAKANSTAAASPAKFYDEATHQWIETPPPDTRTPPAEAPVTPTAKPKE